jgi:hypothetical protein
LDADNPFFGPDEEIFFRQKEGKNNYVCRVKKDGSGFQKVLPHPILFLWSLSVDHKKLIVEMATGEEDNRLASMAYGLDGGTPVRICDFCYSSWTPDGKSLVIQLIGMGGVKTYVIALPPGKALPALPPSGISTEADLRGLRVVRTIEGRFVALGPDPSLYAYVQRTAHCNLYRIPLP